MVGSTITLLRAKKKKKTTTTTTNKEKNEEKNDNKRPRGPELDDNADALQAGERQESGDGEEEAAASGKIVVQKTAPEVCIYIYMCV